MRRAAICLALALTACPPFHELTGRACAGDDECGLGLVCHRSACAAAGSFETVAVDLRGASASEGGVDVTPAQLQRSATRPGLGTFVAAPATARSEAAAAGSWVLGGGTADVTELVSGAPATPLPSPRSALAAAWAPGRLYALGGRAADRSPLAEVLSAPVLWDAGLGEWTAETALPTARHGLAAVAAGGFVYAIGGETAAGLTADVLAAPILAGGGLGPWRAAGKLPDARARHGAAAFDGSLYVAAGSCAGSACGPLRLTLLADGGVGPAASLAELPQRELAAVAIAGGALHVIGGRASDGTLFNEVNSLALDESGASGWLPQPPLAQPLFGAAAVALPDTLAVVGGVGEDGGLRGEQLSTSISAESVGPWSDGPDLAQALLNPASVVWNGALYVIGGYDHTEIRDTIYRTELAADGGLRPWQLAGHTPAPGAGFGAIGWGGRLYLFGGCSSAGVANGDCLGIDDVAIADFLPDGGVSAFRDAGHLLTETETPAIAALNGTVYLVGGLQGYTTVLDGVAKVAVDSPSAALGPIAATMPLPPQGLVGAGIVASRGTLYVVGGFGGPDGDYQRRTLLGTVSGDATVSGWSASPSLLPERRSNLAAVGFDDAVFAVGGCNEATQPYCGDLVSSVPAARLSEDGGLGPFTVSSQEFSRPREGLTAATLGGNVIAIGGYDGNVHEFTDVGRLHGRGQLGARQLLAAAPADVFVSDGHWLFSLGGTTQQAKLIKGMPGAWMSGASAGAKPSAAAVLGSTLYVAAGTGLSSAPISADTGLGTFTAEPPLPRAAVALAAGPAALYLFAGQDVFVGRPTPWAAGPSLPSAVRRALVARDHLFAIGGDSGEIFVSALLPDGSLGEWRRADGLPGPRDGFGAAAADGMLYVAGGTGFSDVMVAPIHADGSLGTWATVASRVPAKALVATPGWLLALGDQAMALPRLTPPSRGVVSVRVDLGRSVAQLEAISLAATGHVSTQARLAGDDGAFGDWLTLGEGTELTVGKPARAVWLRVTLFDDAALNGVSLSTKL